MSPRTLVLSAEFPPGPGGIGTHAHQLALQLLRHDWDVSVATVQELAKPDQIDAFNRASPVPIHHLAQPRGGAPAKLVYRCAALTRLVRKTRPDLVIATGERMVWVAAAVAPILRVPYVAIGHAMEFNVPSRWQRSATKRSFGRAAGTICVSRYTQARMFALGVNGDRHVVIPNGADETRFRVLPAEDRSAFRREHGVGDRPLLVTVGSVHERKGQDVVIRALPQIAKRHPDVQYFAVGSPFRRDAFMEIAKTCGVADRVRFLGVVDAQETVRALNAADLFMMTSQHTPNGDFEGYGIAVVEAALCGRAAVVSDNSGVTEAIEPGETGLVARISDPSSTAECVIELLDDRPRLARMGQLARERAVTAKTWRHRGVAYDQFLRELVQA